MGERLQRKHKMDEKREGGLRALWNVDGCVYEIIERWLVGWLVFFIHLFRVLLHMLSYNSYNVGMSRMVSCHHSTIKERFLAEQR